MPASRRRLSMPRQPKPEDSYLFLHPQKLHCRIYWLHRALSMLGSLSSSLLGPEGGRSSLSWMPGAISHFSSGFVKPDLHQDRSPWLQPSHQSWGLCFYSDHISHDLLEGLCLSMETDSIGWLPRLTSWSKRYDPKLCVSELRPSELF